MPWQKVKIEKGRYRNEKELVGYQETNPYYKAKPLYPALPETQGLFEQVKSNLQLLTTKFPHIKTGYKIFKLPKSRALNNVNISALENLYQETDQLQSLQTTLVTYVVLPKFPNGPNNPKSLSSSIGYYYTPGKTTTLSEIVKKTPGVSRSESPDVKEKRTALRNTDALYSNFGFYITRNLIGGPDAPYPVPWAHNTRYPPQFHLPSTLYSFLGFHAFTLARPGPFGSEPQVFDSEVFDRESQTESVAQTRGGRRLARLGSTFQGFERSLVGIRHEGQVEIIPPLSISSYTIHFDKHTKLKVDIIDPPSPAVASAEAGSPILFTPNFSTPEIETLRAKIEQSYWTDDAWQKFAPYVGEGRTNLFIANKGNGQYPEDYITTVWQGRCPLPAFGAVLSFNQQHFAGLFGSIRAFSRNFLNKKIEISPNFPDYPNPRTPHPKECTQRGTAPTWYGADLPDFPNYQLPITNYKTIYGSFAPLVLNGKYLFNCDKDEIMHRLGGHGNLAPHPLSGAGFTSPLEMLGQETKTLAPFIREPRNVLFETENYIGNILFSGRYELSIGASLIDLTHITHLLDQNKTLVEPVKHALILDSGSAARVVFVRNGRLYPLNIVAPGARNRIGDPSGNFYSGICFNL